MAAADFEKEKKPGHRGWERTPIFIVLRALCEKRRLLNILLTIRHTRAGYASGGLGISCPLVKSDSPCSRCAGIRVNSKGSVKEKASIHPHDQWDSDSGQPLSVQESHYMHSQRGQKGIRLPTRASLPTFAGVDQCNVGTNQEGRSEDHEQKSGHCCSLCSVTFLKTGSNLLSCGPYDDNTILLVIVVCYTCWRDVTEVGKYGLSPVNSG